LYALDFDRIDSADPSTDEAIATMMGDGFLLLSMLWELAPELEMLFFFFARACGISDIPNLGVCQIYLSIYIYIDMYIYIYIQYIYKGDDGKKGLVNW